MGKSGKHQSHTRSSVTAILPLVPQVFCTKEENKTKFIQVEVKDHAGESQSKTHKKYIRIFEEDTVQEWIELLQTMKVVWAQNGTTNGRDQASQLSAVLKGESLSIFESYIEDQRLNPSLEDPTPLPITPMMVENAIAAVSEVVFPFRALDTQKRWMQNEMRKPSTMSTRKFSANLNRLNNCLPFFPDADEDSKFDEKELLHIMEFALPKSWLAKFDLKGYTPAFDVRSRLIQECEALERYEAGNGRKKEEENQKKDGKDKKNNNSHEPSKFQNKNSNHKGKICSYCKKPNHIEAICRIKKRDERNKGPKTNQSGGGKSEEKTAFSKRSFRKESNAIVKLAKKNGCIEILEATLAKASKSSKKGKSSKKKPDSDDEAEESDEESVHVLTMESPIPRKSLKNIPAKVPTKNVEVTRPSKKAGAVSKQPVKWVMRSDETDEVLAEAKAKEERIAAALARQEAGKAKIRQMLLTNKGNRRPKVAKKQKPIPVDSEDDENTSMHDTNDDENEAYVSSLVHEEQEPADAEMTDAE